MSRAGDSGAWWPAASRAGRFGHSPSTREILAELPALAREITNGTFDIHARPTPPADVEQAWAYSAATTQRIVLTPGPGAAGAHLRG